VELSTPVQENSAQEHREGSEQVVRETPEE
jgi:hypothetical protein